MLCTADAESGALQTPFATAVELHTDVETAHYRTSVCGAPEYHHTAGGEHFSPLAPDWSKFTS